MMKPQLHLRLIAVMGISLVLFPGATPGITYEQENFGFIL